MRWKTVKPFHEKEEYLREGYYCYAWHKRKQKRNISKDRFG